MAEFSPKIARLTGPSAGPSGGEAVLLAHVLGDLEPAQPLDLPLRRAGPQRVGAPHDVVGAQALDQHAHQRRAEARLDHRGLGEDLAEIAVDVADAVLGRDLGEVAGPFDAAGLLELRIAVRRGAGRAGPAIGRVVDDEADLRPVLGRLADIVDRGVGREVREALLGRGRIEALVDADDVVARPSRSSRRTDRPASRRPCARDGCARSLLVLSPTV